MTLDIIGCCAFGVDVNSTENPHDDIFLAKCRDIFGQHEKKEGVMKLEPYAGNILQFTFKTIFLNDFHIMTN